MQREPRLIAVDWGTSNFRSYLIDETGRILADVQSADGILTVKAGRFAEVLRSRVGPWVAQHGPLPVIMSGMIGSRQGWIEVPYVHCPARVSDLAAGLKTIDAEGIGKVHIVPGLDHFAAGGIPDVMRGEETQVLGALALEARQEGLFIHPGTHSKWVSVVDGAIVGFSTYMTGEAFAALKQHTILGRLMAEGDASVRGFASGVEHARENTGPAGSLLHSLFSVRTLGLFEMLSGQELSDYLSGLLIGSEIRAAAVPGQIATILGSEELDCLAAGQVLIARAAGLIKAE